MIRVHLRESRKLQRHAHLDGTLARGRITARIRQLKVHPTRLTRRVATVAIVAIAVEAPRRRPCQRTPRVAAGIARALGRDNRRHSHHTENHKNDDDA